MDVQKILQRSWFKDWEGPFSLLFTRLAIDCYHAPMKKILGLSIPRLLFIQRNGINSCYLDEKDMVSFAKQVAKKESAKDIAQNLKNHVDKVRLVLENEMLSTQTMKNARTAISEMGVYQVANKLMSNYVPKKDQVFLTDARKYSEMIYFEFAAYVTRWAQRTAQQTSYQAEHLELLTLSELDNWFEKQKLPPKEVLEQRYLCSGFSDNDQERFELSKEDILAIESSWSQDLGDEVKGQTACEGKAKGRARIVLDFKNAEFEEGDILITGMTDPNYLHLMHKAAAIVTDAGGVLCHAAIVSREIGTPCVIGTKVATLTFKDDDVIEVDATNGVVKKVK